MNNNYLELELESLELSCRRLEISFELEFFDAFKVLDNGGKLHMIWIPIANLVEHSKHTQSYFCWRKITSLLDENRDTQVHIIITKTWIDDPTSTASLIHRVVRKEIVLSTEG
jgi:hypothetical protein